MPPPTEAAEGAKRRLSAIMVADIVGYSRLVGNDEIGALSAVRDIRERIVEPLLSQYDGRIVKLMGDGLLLEFGSAINAVKSAMEIQRGLAARSAATPVKSHIQFRIGIHVGDVVIDEQDILGDGVPEGVWDSPNSSDLCDEAEEDIMIDEEKLQQFLGKMMVDLGAALSVPLMRTGIRLGLYKAMDGAGPMTSAELAAKTNISERYAREWLAQNAASGYLSYDPGSRRFELPPEQAMVFADEKSPCFMGGGFDAVATLYQTQPLVEGAFKSGGGIDWGDHAGCLFCAVGAMLRPRYSANIVQNWLPALDGVVSKLERGAKVADIGCGTGYSTFIMAKAFPNSTFIGYDFHQPSIEHAAERAHRSVGAGNLRFEVATAKNFPARDLDLVTCFDVLHDLGDPVGAATHIRRALKPDGTWMLMEPLAGDATEDNLGPRGRVAYAFSTMACVPVSLSQEVGMALGAQAGQRKLTEVIQAGGFGRVRRAAETPLNMILEARH